MDEYLLGNGNFVALETRKHLVFYFYALFQLYFEVLEVDSLQMHQKEIISYKTKNSKLGSYAFDTDKKFEANHKLQDNTDRLKQVPKCLFIVYKDPKINANRYLKMLTLNYT